MAIINPEYGPPHAPVIDKDADGKPTELYIATQWFEWLDLLKRLVLETDDTSELRERLAGIDLQLPAIFDRLDNLEILVNSIKTDRPLEMQTEDVTGSRSMGTVYTNTGDGPMLVEIEVLVWG